MGLDEAESKFDVLLNEWINRQSEIENEPDTRFQIIDRMLTEVLGWQHNGIRTEPKTESGYIDYLLIDHGRNRFVVEAKRASKILINSKAENAKAYKVSGSALASAKEGFGQARRYCSESGVLFSALTSGFEWIAYWAIRTDGRSPSEGKAFTFPSLIAIKSNFALFYDLFSCEGLSQNLYQVHICEAEGLEVHHKETLSTPVEDTEVVLRPKSKLVVDLENIYRGFFSKISGKDDPEMLAKCFVETKESREADNSLSKIAENLINEINVVKSSDAKELQEQIEIALSTKHGEFVLIIGNKGAGKSTFIDRFFRLVLAKQLSEKCLILRVNLADSTGDADFIAPWLTEQLKKETEMALFNGNAPSYEQLQGIFMDTYDRWRYGERKHLYKRDKIKFKEMFGEWLVELAEKDPNKYLTSLLKNAVKARSLMPCIIFDNTDHFPQHFQERVFQFAQSVFNNTFCFVICPITDRTIWQLSKSGPLQSYKTRTFYLPVPSTKEVISKRVEFVKEKAQGTTGSEASQYFLNKGIRLRINDIQGFAACVEDIFITEEYIGRIIGWLSNHDIRRSLEIAERIITSPIIKIEELVKAYVAGKRYQTSRRSAKQALIVGDYSFFNQTDSNFILNIFSVSPDGVTSPLTKMSILRLLMDKDFESKEPNKAYVVVEDILNYLEPAKLSRLVVKNHLTELLEYRLIEPYDPTDIKVYEDQRLRVTHCGRIHWELALNNREAMYMTQMALRTPVRDFDLISKIRNKRTRKLVWNDWIEIASWFADYCIHQDSLFFDLPNTEAYAGQRKFRDEFRQVWVKNPQ